MKNRLNLAVLLTIILIAGFLRLYNLRSIPPHLTPDEAALGYNAYSILKTGKDEYGKFLPIVFKSFGDYKPGLYIYSIVPSIAILGLNEFSVRFPSAIFGIISVYLVYLISNILFEKKFTKYNLEFGIIPAVLLAINPWHIHFSRGAWEINLSLMLTLSGIYFFFKSLQKQRYLVLSVVSFALTLLAYQGAKLSTGIVVLILFFLYAKQILSLKIKNVVIPVIFGLVIAFPIILSLFSGQTGRLNVFSVFSYPRPKEYLQTFLDEGGEKVGNIDYYLYHSETYNFLRGVLGRYFNHYSDRFLFFEGDWQNPRHSPPNQGLFIHLDMILLITGIVYLVKRKTDKASLFVWLWLLLASLPSVLSRDQVHAVRSFNLVTPFIILNAFGVLQLTEWISKVKLKSALYIISTFGVLIYFANYMYFLDAYFIHLSIHDSKYWEYGYKQIVETVTPIQNNYKRIEIQQSYAQPYIYFLFYQKYDPVKYQKQARLKENASGDVGQVEQIDNIYFVPIDWSRNRGDHGSLVVADLERIPDADSADTNQFNLIQRINYLDGRTAFKIIEIK
ncbi:glycosyltransferase family 39 protein [Candidatus Microgenomates bacterium]|nr:glycosyltransferase family 39 protein [Candidatus Microgenomates bacterium]